jgi:hypothetical protein
VEQELLTLPVDMSSQPVLVGLTEILLKVALNTITLTMICILNYDLMKNVAQAE